MLKIHMKENINFKLTNEKKQTENILVTLNFLLNTRMT